MITSPMQFSFVTAQGIFLSAIGSVKPAFCTVWHDWLLLILERVQVPAPIRNVVLALYTQVTAYSSGAGGGSFLFYGLECGITWCPPSSVCFLLCVDPRVHLILMLSDNLGYSVKPACVDDFGYALRLLKTLRTHPSIFSVVREIAGFHLKPSKCVLIVSCCCLG